MVESLFVINLNHVIFIPFLKENTKRRFTDKRLRVKLPRVERLFVKRPRVK